MKPPPPPTILLLTVGGTCAPILTSIAKNEPEFVYFLCSADSGSTKGSYAVVEGAGKVCPDSRSPRDPNILVQTGLNQTPERYEIIKIPDFDNLNACYREALNVLLRAKESFPGARIIADYTGGTKSMSAGLAAAAMDVDDVEVCVVKGQRADLEKVTDGTQRIRLSRTLAGALERRQRMIQVHMAGFDYASAVRVAEEVLAVPDLPTDVEPRLASLRDKCLAFDAWDKFDHDEALQRLRPFAKQYHPFFPFLEAVIAGRKVLGGEGAVLLPRKASGYEIVHDLMLNAARRAAQRRFDDAVARLYRSLELLAQIRLKLAYGVDTANVEITILPEAAQVRLSREYGAAERIQLPLVRAYEMLEILDTGAVGGAFGQAKPRILNALQIRNHSILAHGYVPVDERAFRQVEAVIGDFVREQIPFGTLRIEQLPADEFGQ